jgi:hypothetical protein
MSTPDLETRIQQIRAAAREAAAARARAEAARDGAQRHVDAAMAELREKFGVSTIEEAQALLAALESQAADEAAAVERALQGASVA